MRYVWAIQQRLSQRARTQSAPLLIHPLSFPCPAPACRHAPVRLAGARPVLRGPQRHALGGGHVARALVSGRELGRVRGGGPGRAALRWGWWAERPKRYGLRLRDRETVRLPLVMTLARFAWDCSAGTIPSSGGSSGATGGIPLIKITQTPLPRNILTSPEPRHLPELLPGCSGSCLIRPLPVLR
mgnify:CR=1 FL=1